MAKYRIIEVREKDKILYYKINKQWKDTDSYVPITREIRYDDGLGSSIFKSEKVTFSTIEEAENYIYSLCKERIVKEITI